MVANAAHRAVDRNFRIGIHQHILVSLAKKLERQRDMGRIDVVRLGDVGDVRHTVRRTGGDGAWYAALKTIANRV